MPGFSVQRCRRPNERPVKSKKRNFEKANIESSVGGL
jgi:hypothetical protein